MDGTEAGAAGVARLIEILLTPTSLIAVALAGAAILAILLLAGRRSRTVEAPQAPAMIAAETAPPLLETPLKIITPGRERLRVALPTLGRVASGVAVTALGVAALLGLKTLASLGAEGAAPSRAGTVAIEDAWPDAWEDDGTVLAGAACEARGTHAGAYTSCGAGVPVTYEAIGLSRRGEALRDAVWSGQGRRAVVLTASRQPTPFTLDAATDLRLAPGADLSGYDAFVAVGYADPSVDGETAPARAESRGYALQDFMLDALPRRRARDCAAAPVVHAVSLGARRGEGGPAPAPVLIGLRAGSLVNGDAGSLDAALEELFAPEAARVLGVVPDAYGPWTLLSSVRACEAA